jgi:hypothetical protein
MSAINTRGRGHYEIAIGRVRVWLGSIGLAPALLELER